jgi:hypothetical protein
MSLRKSFVKLSDGKELLAEAKINRQHAKLLELQSELAIANAKLARVRSETIQECWKAVESNGENIFIFNYQPPQIVREYEFHTPVHISARIHFGKIIRALDEEVEGLVNASMTIRHLTQKVTAKNAESTTLLVTIAGSGFHTKGEMMSEEGFSMTTPLDTLHEESPITNRQVESLQIVKCNSNVNVNVSNPDVTNIDVTGWGNGNEVPDVE